LVFTFFYSAENKHTHLHFQNEKVSYVIF
jgi:hypothetical protein